ncbi:hypothetical protein GCM10018966_019840 [Streptomyces yanii]
MLAVLPQPRRQPVGPLLLVQGTPVLVDKGNVHALTDGLHRFATRTITEAGSQRRVPLRDPRPAQAERVDVEILSDLELDLRVVQAGPFPVAGLEEDALLRG